MEARKIALVSDWYSPGIGGVEVQIEGLAHALSGRGHDVHVVTTTPGADSSGDVTVHRLPLRRMPGTNVTQDFSGLKLLAGLYERERFDVVHAHGLTSPLAVAGAFLSGRRGVATVMTSHSLFRRRPTMPLLSAVFAIWLRRLDVLAAVSEAAAQDAGRISGRQDVAILKNGISTSEWRAPRMPHEGLRILSVMRLSTKKQPLDLIRAVPKVLAAFDVSSRPKFTIVGDGPERKTMERAARDLGVADSVEFQGHLTKARIREHLASSDLFALPTTREAFGLALLEARCAGLPVVAMNHGGVSSVVENKRHGLLSDTTSDFARDIVLVLKDHSLRRRLGENAAEGVEEFEWDRSVLRHEEVYDRAQRRCTRA